MEKTTDQIRKEVQADVKTNFPEGAHTPTAQRYWLSEFDRRTPHVRNCESCGKTPEEVGAESHSSAMTDWFSSPHKLCRTCAEQHNPMRDDNDSAVVNVPAPDHIWKQGVMDGKNITSINIDFDK
jgi:hypothetical protein